MVEAFVVTGTVSGTTTIFCTGTRLRLPWLTATTVMPSINPIVTETASSTLKWRWYHAVNFVFDFSHESCRPIMSGVASDAVVLVLLLLLSLVLVVASAVVIVKRRRVQKNTQAATKGAFKKRYTESTTFNKLAPLV